MAHLKQGVATTIHPKNYIHFVQRSTLIRTGTNIETSYTKNADFFAVPFSSLLAPLKVKRPTMLRTLYATVFLLSIVSVPGCSSEPPAEASGEPVPADYGEQQAAAQQKAMEEAMKNQGR